MTGLRIILTGQRCVDRLFCTFTFPLFSSCFMLLIDFHTTHSMQDGAETGYGAKAEEVLGQVRGRYVVSIFSSNQLCV